MINVAKWALLAVLVLPFLELAVFVVAAAAVGFGWALSDAARYASGSHMGRNAGRLGPGKFHKLARTGSAA